MTVPEPLDEFARTDLLLDALAERRPVHVGDPDVDAMATLLEDWRDNLRWPPASALVSAEEAVTALRTGLADRRRGRRGLATIGSVAAALLVLSGFGAMVVEARPGTTLYGMHAMFFDQPRVNEKHQALLSARADLAKVQESIDQGRWDEAKNQLTEVSSLVQSIDDPAGKQELTNQLKLLNLRVASRNPNATLPPPANTPSAWSTPPTPVPTAAATPSEGSPAASATPSPSQSWSKHRHHGQTSTVTPNTP
ncbi:anti-sigma-D factor RsdA [Mycobacterium europaeum]|uniref:anti-sigma-D factor RsdA n=1 Tax=Mycobacterium europaeum TaxID=761804 RepID=UPI001AD7FDC8|nr:anti-sigma-D factor RsdA [Mycobacterium europaeum]MEA1159818.1 anti-sigma-D factor RsdA [Mycobacterium europaeum]